MPSGPFYRNAFIILIVLLAVLTGAGIYKWFIEPEVQKYRLAKAIAESIAEEERQAREAQQRRSERDREQATRQAIEAVERATRQAINTAAYNERAKQRLSYVRDHCFEDPDGPSWTSIADDLRSRRGSGYSVHLQLIELSVSDIPRLVDTDTIPVVTANLNYRLVRPGGGFENGGMIATFEEDDCQVDWRYSEGRRRYPTPTWDPSKPLPTDTPRPTYTPRPVPNS